MVRRFGVLMALPSVLCVNPISVNPASSSKVPGRIYGHDSDSSFLAKEALVLTYESISKTSLEIAG